MTDITPSRVRTGRRLTIAAATAACLLALPGAGVANAQTPGGAAASQYTVPPVTSTSPVTTTTTPDTGVADNGDDTSTGDGSGEGTDDDGSSPGSSSGANPGSGTTGTNPGSGTTGTGSGAGQGTTPGTTTQGPVKVDYAAFGTADKRVRRDIREALRRGRLLYRYVKTTDRRLNRFISGSLAKQVTTAGPGDLGRRVGAALTSSTPLSTPIYEAIFGRKFEFRPFNATVLSRGDKVSAQQVAFLRGLAAGFGAAPVPTVYVERSDDKKPHTDEFENIPGVGIVDDIDTDAGKAELVRLLTTGTNASVPASTRGGSLFDKQSRAAMANVGDDASSSAPAILLVLLVLGGVVFTGGTLVRRRR